MWTPFTAGIAPRSGHESASWDRATESHDMRGAASNSHQSLSSGENAQPYGADYAAILGDAWFLAVRLPADDRPFCAQFSLLLESVPRPM